MDRPLRFQIIVPCFNEEKRFPTEEFKAFLSRSSNFQFLFVNDGSSDGTKTVLDQLNQSFPDKTAVLHLDSNSGKAEAIRQGVIGILKEGTSYDYLGYIDADLSTPLSELDRIEGTTLSANQPAFLMGSRIKLFGSTDIQRSSRRHYIGRVIATSISRILKLAVYDTQCGFKFVRFDTAKTLFEEPFLSRWLFDVEIILRLIQMVGYQRIEEELYEFPLAVWKEKGQSKIPMTYGFRLPFELWKIKRHYRV